MRTIDIQTASGTARTRLFTPREGKGPWPVLMLCTDAGGQRPAFDTLGQAMADQGLLVAVPDLFFRTGSPLLLLPEAERTFAGFIARFRGEPEFKDRVGAITRTAISEDAVRALFAPVIDALTALPDAAPGPMAVSGYCMGGTVSLRVASLFPERVKAAASFHGGNLVTPEPTSPHLAVPRISAEVLVAAAVDDASFPEDMERTLRATFQSSGTRVTLERWAGAHHGFAVPDTFAFTPEHGARHLRALGDLCRRVLAARV